MAGRFFFSEFCIFLFFEVNLTFLDHLSVLLLIMITFWLNFAIFGGFEEIMKSKMSYPRWPPFENIILTSYDVISSCFGPQRKHS